MTRDDRVEWLEAALTESIVILDGGMGTMIRAQVSGRATIEASDSGISHKT